jgi:hypothetical protein
VFAFRAGSVADVLAKLRFGLRVDYFSNGGDDEPLRIIADDLARLTGR